MCLFLDDVAIITVTGVVIHDISKLDAINLSTNYVLNDPGYISNSYQRI